MASYTYTAKNNGYTATLTLTPGKQDIVANTTVVAYKLSLTAGSNYFQLWPIGWEIWLAGSQVAYQAIRGAPQKSISAGGTITLVSGSTTITHNADGTKAASISFRVDGGDDASYLPGTVRYTGKETLPLPTIPRASGLTLSANSVTLNGSTGSVKVTISPHSDSFTHKVKYTFGSASGEISLAAGAKTGTLTLPMSLLNQIPNTTSGTATVTLTTYSSGSAIGTETAQLTIIAGAGIVPTISAFTAERVGQSALNMYIKGYDRARLKTTAAGAYGSTIKSYAITGGLSGETVTTGVLWNSGKNSWTVKVTDSRGRTATASVSVDVVDYGTPTIQNGVFERCQADGTPDDDGTYLRVSAEISISSCNGANSCAAKVQYKLQTTDTWTDAGAFTGSSQLYDLILSDQAYDARIAVTDKLSTGYAVATLDVGDVIMDYDPDAHKLDLLPNIVNTRGSLQVQGNDVLYPVEEGENGIWTWIKYASGVAVCRGSKSIDSVTAGQFTAWGAWYSATIDPGEDFPVEFISVPQLFREISTAAGAGVGLFTVHSVTNTGRSSLVRPNANGVTGIKISYLAVGRWN